MATKTPSVTLDATRAQLREIEESRREWERTASREERGHFLQLDIAQLGHDYNRALQEITRLNAELDEPVYVGAMGMHVFDSEEQARAVWDIIQFLLSHKTWAEWRANPKLHKPFPPDVAAKRRQRQQEAQRREFRARLLQQEAIAVADQARTGGVSENLLQ